MDKPQSLLRDVNSVNPFAHLRYLREEKWLRKGFERFAHYINNPSFTWDHQNAGQLPRNRMWRPYRFCVQDVVLGVTVIRHNPHFNRLDVDVFLTASIPEYEPDAGVRDLALLILSDAYKCGTTMEIHFTRNVEGGHVPEELQALAWQYGIAFEYENLGIITPVEANRLYLALTQFDPTLQELIFELAGQGQLSVAQTCFSVHYGLWERAEVEALIYASPAPGSILGGQSPPENRLQYRQDIAYGRAALIFGSLDRHLHYRSHEDEEGNEIHLEDDVRNLEREIDPDAFAVHYRCAEEGLVLPWVLHLEDGSIRTRDYPIPRDQGFTIMLRARDNLGIKHVLSADIKVAKQFRKESPRTPVHILVPRDFDRLRKADQIELLKELPEGIAIMKYPSYCSSLDAEAGKRIKIGRVLRS